MPYGREDSRWRAPGGDGSTIAKLKFNPSNDRLTSVVIAADWQRRVGAEDLGDALVAAISGHAFADFERGLEQAEQLVSQLGAAIASLPRGISSDPAGQRHADAGPAVDRSRRPSRVSAQQLNRLVESLLVAERRQSVSDVPSGTGLVGADSHVGRSSNRRVEVTLVQELVTRVTIDTAWATGATPAQLSTAVMEAFNDAYAATDETERTKPEKQGTADAFRSLVAELDELGFPVRSATEGPEGGDHAFPLRGDR